MAEGLTSPREARINISESVGCFMFGYKSANMKIAYERVLKNEVARVRRVEVASPLSPPPTFPVTLRDGQTTYATMHYLGLIR